ncbi:MULTISPECIES: EsaB/YukD family protein [unclassified Saccharopolyspora]|uniref:EsaB/YukD family protein n=2 Tax=Pseudonocardiaceae TaxID=2070 RepID=UPI001909F4AA|nr:EsaB/YukD family protein [Saccharopolyspora sp. HNM0986]MBK0866301.1 EsaB/YukD family protein [Saccharopolyspora sp. HNM0986]
MNPAAATGTLTRVTLAAPWRRVDLVIPSETALGELLPEIVRLLGYRTVESPQSYRLSLFDGTVVELDQSPRSADIADGALLRVDRISDAPMPAVVHDVTDEVADDLERRPGRWGDAARRWVATGVIAAAGAWAVAMALPVVPPVAALAAGLVVLIAGSALGIGGVRAAGTAVLLAGAAVAATAVPQWSPEWPQRLVAWIALAGLTVLGASAANRRPRSGLTGAGALFGLLALWVVPPVLGFPLLWTATVLALASTVLLGLLPRIALVTSGLTRLDDQQLGERPASRGSVRAAVDSAHRGLALAVLCTAASAAVAGWVLAHGANAWALALACLLGVSTFLRTRACPLVVEVAALTAATLVVVAGLVSRWAEALPAQWWGAALVALLVLAAGFVALTYRPPAHVQARARQIADRVEGIAVIAMVPVAVGVFGLYSQLLN